MAVCAGGLGSIQRACDFPVLEERESAVVGGIDSLAVALRAVVDTNVLVTALRDSGDDRILELAARAGATVVAYSVRDLTDAERFGDDVREVGVFNDDQC
jgi:hypothetical protein